MVGGLHHQQQIEVLITLGVVLQAVHTDQSVGYISDDPLHHLRLLWEGKGIQY